MFFFLGVTPPGQEATAAQNHSPLFFADESALPVGVRVLANLAVDYLRGNNRPRSRRQAARSRPRAWPKPQAPQDSRLKTRSSPMNRRRFVLSSATAAAGLALGRVPAWAQAPALRRRRSSPRSPNCAAASACSRRPAAPSVTS